MLKEAIKDKKDISRTKLFKKYEEGVIYFAEMKKDNRRSDNRENSNSICD